MTSLEAAAAKKNKVFQKKLLPVKNTLVPRHQQSILP
jgi:hypothetical protein